MCIGFESITDKNKVRFQTFSSAMQSCDIVPLPRPSACSDCGARMRYVAMRRNRVHSELSYFLFVCECGRTDEQVIVFPSAA
jgi:hypothetical protein